jgi:hypothetical protein
MKRNDAKKHIFTELENNEVKNNFANSHPENIQFNFPSLVVSYKLSHHLAAWLKIQAL